MLKKASTEIRDQELKHPRRVQSGVGLSGGLGRAGIEDSGVLGMGIPFDVLFFLSFFYTYKFWIRS
jgi:hypothetical protein